MFVRDYDWEDIRKYYEAGHTMAECKQRFGFSNNSWDKAVARGRITPRKNPVRRYRHETRGEIKRLLEEGLSQSAIAFQLGLSKPTVSYHARKLGIPSDERASRRYDWPQIQRAHDSGLPARECQARFGFSSSAWHDAVARGVLIARRARVSNEDYFVAGRPRNREQVKRRLLTERLKQDRCEGCGLNEWRGRSLRLTLHHVNRDGYDNRLENLELLCPNCHSQTANYGGRNGHRRTASADRDC